MLSCSQEPAGQTTKTTSKMYEKTGLEQPQATKQPKALTIHDDTRIDNYYWLNERENEEVIAYLNAENDYTKGMMNHLDTFQEKLYKEIIDRLKPDDASVPYKDNGYYYITRYEKGKEYPIYSRKKGTLEAAEEIMLNAN
ncbi:MAG: oligopeptidase B, partial [Phaeodactylibacter sp.]|nr:oligopeptidase B [Phaeodactylibacter sp.]